MAESLETRQVLSALSTVPSASISGIDTKGDRWTLTLYGPGTINVVDKNGTAFTKANQNTPMDIDTIVVSGTVTSQSRLVGTVNSVPANSDGRVFFRQLIINDTGTYPRLDPNEVTLRSTTTQNGISAVNMPNFWLGNTAGTAPTERSSFHSVPGTLGTTFFNLAGGIYADEGINVLRFGGVDTTYTPNGGTALNATNQNNEFIINLGTPITTGTSIIVDKVITDAGSTTSSGTTTTFQQSVSFVVNGRLNLFQANEIDGNTGSGLVPTQFNSSNSASSTSPGGTYVVSDNGGLVTTGQIGKIKVGGDATNFSVMTLSGNVLGSPPADPVTGPQVQSFFIGGETNNVILVAPSGSRRVQFGRGMDNTHINTAFIGLLQANRGAIGSAVTVKRTIDNMIIGGDVVNTLIQSGYDQNLSSVAATPAASSQGSVVSAGGVFNGQAPPTVVNRILDPTTDVQIYSPLAHGGGAIKGRIAGNVLNSIVSVSVDPAPFSENIPGIFQQATSKSFPFGAPENIVLPRGTINVKVEGTIDNSGLQTGSSPFIDPNISPDTAFFAKSVQVKQGPVVPPNVPQAPYPQPVQYGAAQRYLKGLFQRDNSVGRRRS